MIDGPNAASFCMEGGPDGTAFVFDRADAESFVAARPSVGRIVSLTPSGRLVLDKAGLNPIPSDRVYSDISHARVVSRLKRSHVALLRRMADFPRLSPAAAQILISRNLQVAAAAAAFWEMMRGRGPWTIMRNGRWDVIEDQHEAHEALLTVVAGVEGRRGKPQSRFTGFVVRIVLEVAGLLSRSRGTVVLVNYLRGMRSLIEVIEKREKLDVITLGLGGPDLWSSVAHAIKLVLGERNGLRVLSPSHQDAATVRTIREIALGPNDDSIVARGYAAFVDMLASDCSVAATIAKNFIPILKRLKTRAVVSWDLSSPNNVGLVEAGHHAGATTYVASHATASPPGRSLDVYFRELFGTAVTGAGATDVAIAQSPTVASVITHLAPKQAKIDAVPFLWGAPIERSTEASNTALFVWAGNFHRWAEHRAWVDETADEMLDGLIRFVEAVIATPSVTLEVRIKPNWRSKNELDAEAIEYFLPKHERILIRSEGSFAESLSRACAVVSCSSTAIEEAFRGRVPVILWGARNRAPFLPARAVPPTSQNRAAIYSPPLRGDLPSFLGSVAAAHREHLLTDAELDGLVWNRDAANLETLAHEICKPKSAVGSAARAEATVLTNE
jgi:hypothetical protein